MFRTSVDHLLCDGDDLFLVSKVIQTLGEHGIGHPVMRERHFQPVAAYYSPIVGGGKFDACASEFPRGFADAADVPFHMGGVQAPVGERLSDTTLRRHGSIIALEASCSVFDSGSRRSR